MDYYKKPNRFTQFTEQAWMIEQLLKDYGFLFSVVKSILIHPMDANAGKVKYDRKNNGIFQCYNSTVDTILKYGFLEPYLKERKLPLSTKPGERAVLSCDHHALLFVSFLRNQGIAARARTGYASYLDDDLLIPHWITEVYDETKGKWLIIDPERQLQEVNRSKFIFAAEAWKQNMSNGRNFIAYSGFPGKQGLKYALLCDLNSLFKNELLSYEWRLPTHHRKKPAMARVSYKNLSDEQREQIHKAAEWMMDPDNHLNELWQIYSQIVEPQDLHESGFNS